MLNDGWLRIGGPLTFVCACAFGATTLAVLPGCDDNNTEDAIDNLGDAMDDAGDAARDAADDAGDALRDATN